MIEMVNAEDYLKFWATYGITKGGMWVLQNPLDAAAYTMALSHPVTRRILMKVAQHYATQAVRDVTFASRLVYDEALRPILPSSQTVLRASRMSGAALGAATLGYALSESSRINYEYLSNEDNITGDNGQVYAPAYFLDGFA